MGKKLRLAIEPAQELMHATIMFAYKYPDYIRVAAENYIQMTKTVKNPLEARKMGEQLRISNQMENPEAHTAFMELVNKYIIIEVDEDNIKPT